MSVTNRDSGTNVHEIADGIYRISTPIPPEAIPIPGGFTFNQFLVVDDEPVLFHTGPRKLFPLTRGAVAHVMPVEKLRWIAFSHFEADECGALNEFLSAAPGAQPLCSQVAAMVSVNDVADRPARPMGDGEEMSIGKKRVRWVDTPHLPHNWECGYLFETSTRTLFCGDVVTQPGASGPPIAEGGVPLEAAIALEREMRYCAQLKDSRPLYEKMMTLGPRVLACMHGSAIQGDGAKILREYAAALGY